MSIADGKYVLVGNEIFFKKEITLKYKFSLNLECMVREMHRPRRTEKATFHFLYTTRILRSSKSDKKYPGYEVEKPASRNKFVTVCLRKSKQVLISLNEF